ncbi:MAG: AraC family transcriptional regulator ligand-binding domain-containing protein [Beijerinckiaceae bacterium]
MIRISVASSIPRHLRDLGVDPDALVAADGFEMSVFDEPDRAAPYADLVRMVDSAAAMTGCPHFGLLVGEAAGLDTLRKLGDEMRKSRTIRNALELLQDGYSSFDRGGALDISFGVDTVDVRYVVIDHKVTSASHLGDVASSAACSILQDLCGPEWTASAVQLPRRRPTDETPYRKLFKCALAFNRLATTIQFPASWLGKPVRSPLEGCRAEFTPEDGVSLIDHIASICVTTLISGNVPSSRSVAREVAVSERTLLRRLEEHGRSFSSIFAQTRQLAAIRLLNDTDAPLKEISSSLGYSELSAFTRAFRGWTGQPPSRFRIGARERDQRNPRAGT